MRNVIELILLILGAIVLAFSIKHRTIPKGLLEWGIWTIDIVIIAFRIANVYKR